MDVIETFETLLNWNKWPTYTNSKQLSHLDSFARDAFARDTFDGYVSYVLISHQVCEDYVMLLLRHAQLTVRLHVLPSGFGWPKEAYEQAGVRDSDMFGRLLGKLGSTINFESKDEFIDACKKLNSIRNKLAHKLIEGMDLTDLRGMAQEYKEKLVKVVDAFNDADEQFSWFYTEMAKDPRLDSFFAVQVREAPDLVAQEKWEALWARFVAHRERSAAS